MKSITEPAAKSPASSSNTASPSDRRIDDKITEPSCGYFIATRPLPPRSRLARRYSRRPGFLRWPKPARTGNSFGGVNAAPASFRISGFRDRDKSYESKRRIARQPNEWDGANLAQRHRLSRFDRQKPEMQIPQLLDHVPNVVLLACGHPSRSYNQIVADR